MIYEIGKYHEISKISLKGGNVKKLKKFMKLENMKFKYIKLEKYHGLVPVKEV